MTQVEKILNFEPKNTPTLNYHLDNLRTQDCYMGPYLPECTGLYAEQELFFCDTILYSRIAALETYTYFTPSFRDDFLKNETRNNSSSSMNSQNQFKKTDRSFQNKKNHSSLPSIPQHTEIAGVSPFLQKSVIHSIYEEWQQFLKMNISSLLVYRIYPAQREFLNYKNSLRSTLRIFAHLFPNFQCLKPKVRFTFDCV